VTHWANEAELKATLENPTGLKPPPSKLQLLRSAFWPALIMIALRPIIWGSLLVLAVAIWALWHLHH
jgi:hypothetical protein